MDLQPELLLHPNIPKPLHGLAPRTIKGEDWWNEQRQKAYSKNEYKCWACGVHKKEAKYHKWLEAHEIYNIDYNSGKVEFLDVCALCHSCHNFIHSGRMSSLFKKGEMSLDKVEDILEHGFKILIKNNLKLNPFALKAMHSVSIFLYLIYNKYPKHKYGKCSAKWEDFYLVLDGKKYKGKFKNFEEWQEFYK